MVQNRSFVILQNFLDGDRNFIFDIGAKFAETVQNFNQNAFGRDNFDTGDFFASFACGFAPLVFEP